MSVTPHATLATTVMMIDLVVLVQRDVGARAGVAISKLFSSSLTVERNKLECFSVTSFLKARLFCKKDRSLPEWRILWCPTLGLVYTLAIIALS